MRGVEIEINQGSLDSFSLQSLIIINHKVLVACFSQEPAAGTTFLTSSELLTKCHFIKKNDNLITGGAFIAGSNIGNPTSGIGVPGNSLRKLWEMLYLF